MSYPAHLDIMGAAMSDVSPLSSHAPAFATLDAIEKEIVDARKAFTGAYAMVYAKSETEAAVVASRLETKGSAPEDLPFMALYATAYKEKCARKKATLDANPLPAAMLALVPHWRPLNLDKPGVKQEDVVAELRAMRYINEQLLLRLHATTKTVQGLALHPRVFRFHVQDEYGNQVKTVIAVQISGKTLKAIVDSATAGGQDLCPSSGSLTVSCPADITSDDVSAVILVDGRTYAYYLKFHVVGDGGKRLFDVVLSGGTLALRAPGDIPTTAAPPAGVQFAMM